MSAMHSVVWLFYCSMSFAICAADGKTNVQIPLLNNKATAPLYAEFNMSNLNQRLREIFNKEVIQNTVNGKCLRKRLVLWIHLYSLDIKFRGFREYRRTNNCDVQRIILFWRKACRLWILNLLLLVNFEFLLANIFEV